MNPVTVTPRSRGVYLAIVVAALGYFVDIYDLILFSIVRVPSLRGIGVPDDQLLSQGVLLLNMQMGGMLVGGILWGILGDKKGRLSVLFGSILLYSIANIANGMVTSIPAYATWRLLAGIGLAGELGAGVTLVSELMPPETRGYGTTVIASTGILGAVVAYFVGDLFDWRIAYYVGGAMGLTLLACRVGLAESGMFEGAKQQEHVARGRFLWLFTPAARLRKYARVVLIALPIWYVVGVLITFSPEFGRAAGMSEVPNAGRAVMFTYVGLTIGGFASGVLSQRLRSRKRAVSLFMWLTALFVAAYFGAIHASLPVFYGICLLLGVGTGYWTVFMTLASEQFGTNIRATVTTTAPNFVRGAVVPLTAAFQIGQEYVGVRASGAAVGAATMIVAFVALRRLEETYGKSLDYLEE
jgi:MFS family permease